MSSPSSQNGGSSTRTEDMFLVLPLKLTRRQDLVPSLMSWLNSSTKGGLSVTECREDMVRLESLRHSLVESVGSGNPDNHRGALSEHALEDAREYHASLLAFEAQGFPISDDDYETTAPGASKLELTWNCALDDGGGAGETHSNLRWERACVLWNAAALESYLAKTHPTRDKAGWTQSMRHLQSAASTLSYLRKEVLQVQEGEASGDSYFSFDFTHQVLHLMEKVFVAQGQVCCYGMALHGAGAPKHGMLAKLAVAASDMYNDCLALATQDATIKNRAPTVSRVWGGHLKSMCMYCKMLGEHHESMALQAKNQYGMELRRLQDLEGISRQAIAFASSIESSLVSHMEHIQYLVKDRLQKARADNDSLYYEEIPKESRAIRGQNLMNKLPPIHPGLITPQRALFTKAVSPQIREAEDNFTNNIASEVERLQELINAETESARKELARVNLPHSLTAHTHNSTTNGADSSHNYPRSVPEELWQRVERVQHGSSIQEVKMHLRELKCTAEACRSSLDAIQKQLDEDLEMDRRFRSGEAGRHFEGHTAEYVQSTVRRNVDSFRELLANAHRGDRHLFQILDELETDPKYKLLNFERFELDRLVSQQAAGSGNAGGQEARRPDTGELSRLLVDLSNNLKEREAELQQVRDDVRRYNIRAVLMKCTKPAEHSQEVRRALRSFEPRIRRVEDLVDEQGPLMDRILEANRIFVEETNNMKQQESMDDSSSCIVMIEDALDTVERVQKHWGDGKEFYDKVTPKLEQLQQQLSDISVRLTIQRCEHEEKASSSERRRQQELEDARMAASLAGPSSEGAAATPHNPGAVSVSHFEAPGVRVDDEKVASLVAMDFDPDKVVAALQKYDNNFEQALNELLTS